MGDERNSHSHHGRPFVRVPFEIAVEPVGMADRSLARVVLVTPLLVHLSARLQMREGKVADMRVGHLCPGWACHSQWSSQLPGLPSPAPLHEQPEYRDRMPISLCT